MDLDIEAVYNRIGSFGVRQKLYFALYGFKDFYVAGPILLMLFSSIKPTYFLCRDASGHVFNNTCPQNDVSQCKSIWYEKQSSSIITEWNLVCSESYKVQLAQSVYMCGVLTGAIVFGYLADVIGRLKTYNITSLCLVFFSSLCAFSPSYVAFVMCRFLTGINVQGSGLSSFVLIVELVASSVRGIVASAMTSFFPLGLAFVSVVAYMIPEWRLLTFVLSVWGVLCVFLYCCIPESPRWHLTTGFPEKAKSVLSMIAEGNQTNHKLPDDWSLASNHNEKVHKNQIEDNLCDLFRHGTLLKCTLIQIYSWFVSGAMYYGLTLAAGSIGNVYSSTVLLSLVEVPAILIQVIFINRIGRRRLVCIFMMTGGISCIVIQLLPKELHVTRVVFALIGKLCSAGQFNVVYVYSAELFPTSLRNSGLGLVSVAARIGGIVCPFIVMLGDYVTNLHFTVLGALAFTAGLGNLGLPETNKRPLPDTVHNLLYPVRTKELHVMAVDVDDFDEVVSDVQPMLPE